jgi:FdhE protein
MPSAPEPDPSAIGGVPRPPFAILPADPAALLQRRAARFAALASSERLGPYLSFLAALSGAMAELARRLPPPPPPAAEVLARARGAAMPPLDRAALAEDPALDATLDGLVVLAAAIDMPPEARLALDAVAEAGAEDRRWLLGNILAGSVPPESIAPHLFAAAAVQVHLARLAGALEAEGLVPLGPRPLPGLRRAARHLLGGLDPRDRQHPLCHLRHLCDAMERGTGEMPVLRFDKGDQLPFGRDDRGDGEGRDLPRMRCLGEDPLSGEEPRARPGGR